MLSEKINPAASGFGKSATHVGQIILSTTLDTVDKVIELYDGEWEPFGAGQVLVGAGTNGGRTFTAGNTGGEYEHTLTIDEMPAHSHSGKGLGSRYDGGANFNQTSGTLGYAWNGGTGSAGGGQPHNNMQPYVVVYMWHRVA